MKQEDIKKEVSWRLNTEGLIVMTITTTVHKLKDKKTK